MDCLFSNLVLTLDSKVTGLALIKIHSVATGSLDRRLDVCYVSGSSRIKLDREDISDRRNFAQ